MAFLLGIISGLYHNMSYCVDKNNTKTQVLGDITVIGFPITLWWYQTIRISIVTWLIGQLEIKLV